MLSNWYEFLSWHILFKNTKKIKKVYLIDMYYYKVENSLISKYIIIKKNMLNDKCLIWSGLVNN